MTCNGRRRTCGRPWCSFFEPRWPTGGSNPNPVQLHRPETHSPRTKWFWRQPKRKALPVRKALPERNRHCLTASHSTANAGSLLPPTSSLRRRYIRRPGTSRPSCLRRPSRTSRRRHRPRLRHRQMGRTGSAGACCHPLWGLVEWWNRLFQGHRLHSRRLRHQQRRICSLARRRCVSPSRVHKPG